MVADPGRYYYRSPGDEAAAMTCGIYIVAPATQVHTHETKLLSPQRTLCPGLNFLILGACLTFLHNLLTTLAFLSSISPTLVLSARANRRGGG